MQRSIRRIIQERQKIKHPDIEYDFINHIKSELNKSYPDNNVMIEASADWMSDCWRVNVFITDNSFIPEVSKIAEDRASQWEEEIGESFYVAVLSWTK